MARRMERLYINGVAPNTAWSIGAVPANQKWELLELAVNVGTGTVISVYGLDIISGPAYVPVLNVASVANAVQRVTWNALLLDEGDQLALYCFKATGGNWDAFLTYMLVEF